jgi:hypothetical protein
MAQQQVYMDGLDIASAILVADIIVVGQGGTGTPGSATPRQVTIGQLRTLLGSLTAVAAGAGLAGGTITSSGTLSLAAVEPGAVLANTGGATAPPGPVTLSALLDVALGATRGTVLFRGAAGWATLSPPATTGYVLTHGGSGADPAWVQFASIMGTSVQSLPTVDPGTGSLWLNGGALEISQ